MKKLLVGLFVIGSLSTFASEVKVKCDHISSDNWPLGGRSPILSIVIVNNEITQAFIDKEKMGILNTSTLVENPNTGANKELYFTIEDIRDLQEVQLGDAILIRVQSDAYMGYFEEQVTCRRININ